MNKVNLRFAYPNAIVFHCVGLCISCVMCCWVYFLFSPLSMFLLVLSSCGLASSALTSHHYWPAACYTHCVYCVPPPLLLSHFTSFIFHSASRCIQPVTSIIDKLTDLRSDTKWTMFLFQRSVSACTCSIYGRKFPHCRKTPIQYNGGRHINNILVFQRGQRSEKRVKQEGKFSQGACWSPTFSLAYAVRFLVCFWPCIWATILTGAKFPFRTGGSEDRLPAPNQPSNGWMNFWHHVRNFDSLSCKTATSRFPNIRAFLSLGQVTECLKTPMLAWHW